MDEKNVVESVAKYSEGEKAGLQVGDVLLSWSRDDAKGEIQSHLTYRIGLPTIEVRG